MEPILIIDNDQNFGRLPTQCLRREGYSVTQARNLDEGINLLADREPLVIASALLLPDGNRFELLDYVMAEEAMMLPEQKMMYELLGGHEAYMKNMMHNYNSDGDYVGLGGIIVPDMHHGKYGSVDRSTWQQLINVSDESRQKMFDNVKREFIQENEFPMVTQRKGRKYLGNTN